MPLPTNEEVADGFLIYWPFAAGGYLGSSIPVERVFYGIVAESIEWPNASIVAELSNVERTSGTTVIVKYDVTIEINTYDTDSGRLTAAAQLGFECNAFNPKVDITNAVSVIHVNAKGGKVEPQDKNQRRDGVDLKKITAKYEVCVQGDREWP